MENLSPSQPKVSKPRIGAILRVRREEQRMTLSQLAELTNLSRGFLSQVENDKASPSLSSLVQIGRALQADVRDLLFVPPSDSIASYSAHRVQYTVPENDVTYE
ncbi:helix-turn-helix domain-containing protein, partial [Brucella grignonensis]|uniref:helix-turn-helix domain-containing protein n=1 Tax=Brucella grignonensis TaxID=94627 RepID=UPI0011404A17